MNDLIYGAAASGKTTFVRGVVNTRIDSNNHSLILTNAVCKRLYWRNESDLLKVVCPSDLTLDDSNNTPQTFALSLVDYYNFVCARTFSCRCIVFDGFDFDAVNPDYKLEAFYEAIANVCKREKIDTVFTYSCNDEQVPKRMLDAADRVTHLKKEKQS
jgi:hypothetical protein